MGDFYTNQISLIKNMAQSLPTGVELFVKEHPTMGLVGWRNLEFYKQIIELPNVKLIHPSFPSEKIYKKCSLVITAVGTSGFEALFYGIPVIVFGDVLYSNISSVTKMNSFDELTSLIQNSLNQKPEPDELNLLLKLLEINSIDFDLFGYYTIQAHEFFHDSHLIDVKISEQKMKNFLDTNKAHFEKIGNYL